MTLGEQNVTYTANMGPACAPRPRVNVANVPAGPNARQVTISTTTNPGFPTNTLKSIQFHETRASTVEAPGAPASAAPLTITYPSGTTQATFTARRSGTGAILVRFTVNDGCGDLGLVHRQRLGDRVLGGDAATRSAPLGERSGTVPLTLGSYPPGTTQVSFILRRTTAGALLARFTVADDCGTWPTFVGAGPATGW